MWKRFWDWVFGRSTEKVVAPIPQTPRKRQQIPSKTRWKLPRCPQTEKVIYPSRAAAQGKADEITKKYPENVLRIYVCEFCHGWHFTHKKRYRW